MKYLPVCKKGLKVAKITHEISYIRPYRGHFTFCRMGVVGSAIIILSLFSCPFFSNNTISFEMEFMENHVIIGWAQTAQNTIGIELYANLEYTNFHFSNIQPNPLTTQSYPTVIFHFIFVCMRPNISIYRDRFR